MQQKRTGLTPVLFIVYFLVSFYYETMEEIDTSG